MAWWRRAGRDTTSDLIGAALQDPTGIHSRGRQTKGSLPGRRSALFMLLAWPATALSQPLEAPTSDASPQRRPTQQPLGISGQVRLPSGQPLRKVVVLARSLDRSPPPIPDIAITTDENGRYFWKLPPGRYELTFVREGKRIATREVSVPGDTRKTILNVTISDAENQ